MNKYIIYTDGACHQTTTKVGGYAAIIIDVNNNTYFELAYSENNTTNNRMELKAVIYGLKQIKESSEIKIVTDSQYIVNAFNKGWIYNWQKQNFINRLNNDLWIELLQLVNKHKIQFYWVKGHNKHIRNERCDQLAVAASNNIILAEFRYKSL